MPVQHATFEHQKPRSEGGANSLCNIIITCQWCNNTRGTKAYWAFKIRVMKLMRKKSPHVGATNQTDLKTKNNNIKRTKVHRRSWERHAQNSLLDMFDSMLDMNWEERNL